MGGANRGEEGYINIPDPDVLVQYATEIGQVADKLEQIIQILQNGLNLLESNAFTGLVGGAAVQAYATYLKKKIEVMSKLCHEVDKDLKASMEAYQRGDAAGANKFY